MPQERSYERTVAIYLACLGGIYAVAFLSFAFQVRGLIGVEGVLPAQALFQSVALRWGWERFLLLPTLAWVSQSDAFLLFLCWGGAVASLGLGWAKGTFRIFSAVVCWVFYLSLVNAGDIFMGYQWEVLLLETGFLAIFLTFCRQGKEKALLVWVHRVLLFRLLMGSALSKLSSGDPTWRDLTALHYHFETQPLPTPLAWYAHQLPDLIQRALTLLMFFCELVVPFFFFLRKARSWAFVLTVVLQLGILLTGNYTYFNWLTLAIALLLLDDEQLPLRPASKPGWAWAPVPRRPVILCGVLLLILGAVEFVSALGVGPAVLGKVTAWPQRFHIVGSYGLFAVMTTERDELVIEGSDDGKEWKEYTFRWKPGDPRVAPTVVAPHQPRLDWQAWFAALGSFPRQAWLHGLLEAILTGRQAPLALLGHNPFAERPPRWVRVLRYRYRFSTPEIKHRASAWWSRDLIGDYSPVLEKR